MEFLVELDVTFLTGLFNTCAWFFFLFCCVEVNSVVLGLLCCVALCCNPLCCVALCCDPLCCGVSVLLRCIVIRCVAVVLSCIALCYIVIRCVLLHCDPLCCIALCCVALLTSSAFLVFCLCKSCTLVDILNQPHSLGDNLYTRELDKLNHPYQTDKLNIFHLP